MIDHLGLWLLLAMTLNMWALISVLRAAAPLASRMIWAILLIALPGLAFLAWFILGPRQRTA